MPITIPAHLIPQPKPRIYAEKVAEAMINAARRDDDASLNAAGMEFSITLFRDGGRSRRYVPASRREGDPVT